MDYNTDTLLIELLTEELPPKVLKKLGQAFAENLQIELEKEGLIKPSSNCKIEIFMTARRLGVMFSDVFEKAEDRFSDERLMPVEIGLTKTGEFTPIFSQRLTEKGFKKNDSNFSIEIIQNKGKQYLTVRKKIPGKVLSEILQKGLESSIANLPIPKFMQYQLSDGISTVRFIRPAHRLLVLFGTQILPINILGLQAGRETYGHRFMRKSPIVLNSAKNYEVTLGKVGYVIASFYKRRKKIISQLEKTANYLGAILGPKDEIENLLDEVTALVEYPTVYIGEFDEKFLQIPSECLILTMCLKQKYFPLFNSYNNKLTNYFLIVSNTFTKDPHKIINGNKRVIHSRLSDAKFFYESDLKIQLKNRVKQLSSVIYHNDLGNQFDRTERIRKIACFIASCVGSNIQKSDRAAKLSKADLLSNMVIEFPELQGIMGAYYAEHDGECLSIVEAIRNQYKNNYDDGDIINEKSIIALTLFVSERLENILGIWGIGLIPSGDSDPFGLRRAAIGIISAFEQLQKSEWLKKINTTFPLSLNVLIRITFMTFPVWNIQIQSLREIKNFIYERYRYRLIDSTNKNLVNSIISLSPPLQQVVPRLEALKKFMLLPEAEKLISINKRIRNLLKNTENGIYHIDKNFLYEIDERILFEKINEIEEKVEDAKIQENFYSIFNILLEVQKPIEKFFQNIFVMSDNIKLRTNRLSLLIKANKLMNRIVDFSKI
ncbi:MAG: glycine--tRNA ligase subunit beta [Bordetella sp.]|nr:MAG: glycine--tRNA ligase subunit beta [Bordetella sp.]